MRNYYALKDLENYKSLMYSILLYFGMINNILHECFGDKIYFQEKSYFLQALLREIWFFLDEQIIQ